MSCTPDTDRLRRLENAMRHLPSLQREIFVAHCMDEMPYIQIARRMGLTVRQVERQIARAIYKLDKQLAGRKLSWWERF